MVSLCLDWLVVLLLFAPDMAPLYGPQEQLEEGVQQFYAGYRSWDARILLQAAETLEKACVARPDDYLAYHWLGITRFHILVQRQGDVRHAVKNHEFKRLVNESRRPLEKAIELNNTDSEAHALLGTLAGMEIKRDPLHVIWLGPVVQRHKQSALRYGQNNPQTQYLLGTALIRGPGFLGGLEKGLAYLHRAEKLFQTRASAHGELPESAMTWGYEHCLILIGETYEHLGDLPKAEDYFSKAILINPQNRLAQRRLNRVLERSQGNE